MAKTRTIFVMRALVACDITKSNEFSGAASGVTDLSVYDCVPGSDLGVDFWVDAANPPGYTAP